MAVLECDALRRRFGHVEAVRGVSFSIAEGETYGLLGPNGAGKTTTISMVCGLLEPDAGSVRVCGRPLTTRSVDAKSAIGYVPQELALYPDLSATENLRFFARLYGLRGGDVHDRVATVLAAVGLAERAGELVAHLLGRDEAAPQHRHRPPAPAAAAGARRADRRGRSAEPQRDPRERRPARQGGDRGPLHDPLHGGGGAALRSRRHHRPGRARRGGDAPRARGDGRRARPRGARGRRRPRGRGCELRRARRRGRRRHGRRRRRPDRRRRPQPLPALLQRAAAGGLQVSSVQVHEPDLESVFLHLTGRALRD